MKNVKNGMLLLSFLLVTSWRPYGDINGDFRASITDVVIVHRIVLGMEHTAFQKARADLNRDGVVDELDLKILHEYLLNK